MRIGSGYISLVQRRRKVTHNAVQKELNTLVLEGRTAACGDNLHRDGTLAQGGDYFFVGDCSRVVEELLHKSLIKLRSGLYESVSPEIDILFHVCWNLAYSIINKLVCGIIVDCLAGNQVYDTLELVLCTDRKANRNSGGAQFGVHFLYTCEEVRTNAVHLVHISDLRHTVLVRLAPYGLRLRLDPAHSAESCDSAVKHPEGTLHLYGKVHVSGSVDEVDLIGFSVIMPEGRSSSRGNGDTPFLLLNHPVHCSGTLMNLSDTMSLSRIIKYTFRRRRLSGVDVGHYADVSGIFKISCHCLI